MAFLQQHRPQSGRQTSYHGPERVDEATPALPQVKTSLEQSEEWVLFSPPAPSTTTRTHTTSTERTPRTAGLSRFSEFGSLETVARSNQDEDVGTSFGTEEELDSLDDGLHAFHEPSEYGAPVSRLQESGDTVLPTHDGLGEFKPDSTMQEHMWHFERSRKRLVRRRSSVQRHLTILDDTDEMTTEQEKRQRIERWRLEQSKALLEEIERETRRRRRMSMVSTTRSRRESTNAPQQSSSAVPQQAPSVSDAQSDSSEESPERLTLWQRITRRVIRDLIGLDDNTLSVIFGETISDESATPTPGTPTEFSADKALEDAGIDASRFSDDAWQTKLLERVAVELGTLVNQLSEHPGAFSTYQQTQSIPDYVGLTPVRSNTTLASDTTSSRPASSQPTTLPASAQFAPTFPAQASHTYSEASLWGIEEEPNDADLLDSSVATPIPTPDIAEELAREREYWEREIDVTMIFNFLIKRFSSRRSSVSLPPPSARTASASRPGGAEDDNMSSARRAAIIRQHHPLVDRTTTDARLPTSSAAQTKRESSSRRYSTYYSPPSVSAGLREKAKLRSSSSCASQSTKKSKRSGNSARNYWDLGGSVGSGSVFAGEV
ncbi:hypothetical protein COCCADRAFT_10450 [Bipolaris zeicola 26-R-13]|uniref:Uncharacterized protein n=1 Tax=Cochliobolus carbonum (strain 26-R-13) TaxID=930089 RepID=W6Y657_COCC2|nr:uncharacterized protein COCCADRAFT_10450 [Bipolaris zeicola 26-R-13]EUC26761.1 hypothetical protein COCCADRAFT_10450 [Bipolaris zeicola 26-R-13]